MKFEESLLKYINQEKEPRQLGRYWASDLYSMIQGKLTPQNFFEKREIELEGAKMIVTGEAMEKMLEVVFQKTGIDYEYQPKKEYQIDEEIVLVVRPDFLFKNFILETKFPFSMIKDNEVPARYCYQLEAEYRVFYLPVYLGVFTIPFNLKMIEYTPSEWRWKRIINTLKDFHKKLKKVAQVSG